MDAGQFKRAMCSWNYNYARWYNESQIKKFKNCKEGGQAVSLSYEYQLYTSFFAPKALLVEKRRRKPNPKVKCLLPGCDNLTDHNGGYCCAEHCHEHRSAKKMEAKL